MTRALQLLSEIRDRRLFRIVVSYLAGGWVVLQVIDAMIDRGYFPELTFRIALIWYLVGIPACLLVGWNHGERGKQKPPPSELAALGLLAIVAVVLSATPVAEHLRAVKKLEAVESGLDLRRLGVMYFTDHTRGEPQQHIADGLTEDLIAELSRVPALDVISRNGMAQVRGAQADIDSVARALGVGTLVDGSVEQVGDRLRVTVRLLDASGAEFRRSTFERPLADTRSLREEVVDESARMLREWLGEQVRLRDGRAAVENPAAWALVQRAERARKRGEELLRHDDVAGMEAEFEKAGELLEQAQLLEPDWSEPLLMRGHLAHRRARLAHSPTERMRWIEEGTRHVEQLLVREPESARGLELRGLLRYWHYLQEMTPDPAEHRRLLSGAREDLESAVRIDGSLAQAHSALSHLYYQFDDTPGVVLAARRAYEEDAYLDAAELVLWRLVTGLYDLQQFTEARRWCGEGFRRFPADPRFTECQLLLMTTTEVPPDVDQAWELARRLPERAPSPRRTHDGIKGQLLAAGVIARAGLPDSALAVLSRAHRQLDRESDPNYDLLLLQAHMRVIAGDQEGAVELLRHYAAVKHDASFDHYWWWHKLRGNPQFEALLQSLSSRHAEGHH